jgi:hypothetical protein
MDKISEQTLMFMRQFNCVCRRMISSNLTIDSDGGAVTMLTAPAKLKGINLNLSLWCGVWSLTKTTVYHPFAIMAAGKKRRAQSVIDDLDIRFGKLGLLESFCQGFYNAKTYRDVWGGYKGIVGSTSYYQSLHFHLGRAFLQKYCGISLPYELPEPFLEQFKKLS